MRRTLLLAFALLAVIAPPAGSATRSIDLPRLFETQLERARVQTEVPILLPQTMRSDFRRHFPEGRARPDAWRFDIGAARDCNQATACFVAEFRAVRGRSPSGPRATPSRRRSSSASSCGWPTRPSATDPADRDSTAARGRGRLAPPETLRRGRAMPFAAVAVPS